MDLIVNREVVENYIPGNEVFVDFQKSVIRMDKKEFTIPPLPEKLLHIIEKKGLVNYLKGE